MERWEMNGESNQCRVMGGQIAAREPRDAAEIPNLVPMFSRLKPFTISFYIHSISHQI